MALVREVVFKKRDCETWELLRGILAHLISLRICSAMQPAVALVLSFEPAQPTSFLSISLWAFCFDCT